MKNLIIPTTLLVCLTGLNLSSYAGSIPNPPVNGGPGGRSPGGSRGTIERTNPPIDPKEILCERAAHDGLPTRRDSGSTR